MALGVFKLLRNLVAPAQYRQGEDGCVGVAPGLDEVQTLMCEQVVRA